MTRLLGRSAVLGSAALAALVAGLAYAGYAAERARAYQRVATGSAMAQTPCGPIEYAAQGAGPAVLVVHGAGGGFDQGRDFGAGLAQAGFRVVAMSRFGYLRTPLPPLATPAAQADAHACLLDALGLERAAIVGLSAGAPSALEFALRHPARTAALVLVVPLAHVPGRPPGEPPSAGGRPGTCASGTTS
ncbi:MAG TPA: alpha/beta fold hydrolase, partial [Burkholderiales bacterium]|nr:alpha/beta fold hydrolase [Burkholderiales bacterium]